MLDPAMPPQARPTWSKARWIGLLDLDECTPDADGAVVGTYFKKDGIFANAVDKSRVQELMGAAREFRTQLA